MFHVPNHYRIKKEDHPIMGSDDSYGNSGAFQIQFYGKPPELLFVIASDQEGWEHVSVSLPNRNKIPNWDMMCYIKKIFWDEEDCVVQFHPPKSQYINNCKNCLHLWRKVDFEFPLPDKGLVGIK